MIVSPAPPSATGVARNVGSHEVTPQYARSTLAATLVTTSVCRRNGCENISNQSDFVSSRSRQMGGSSTPRRMKNAAIAGSAPTRNRTRQPKRVNIIAESACSVRLRS